MKTIYIAGKVSGEKLHECTMKFGKAHKELTQKGYSPINPLEVVGTWQTTWNNAMRLCIKALMECDAILLLPDYKDSKGALLELELARNLKMRVYHSIDQIKPK